MKGCSDLKKLVFSKKQMNLKTKASEKVSYHKVSKKSLYHTYLHELTHKIGAPDLLSLNTSCPFEE